MEPETLAKLVFCFENDPERSDGIVSGAQDAIGICIPGLCRHYYNNRFWPEKIETCYDEEILCWLEQHLVMIPMEPRKDGCNVLNGKDITEEKVRTLAQAADDCWQAIIQQDLQAFAKAYADSFQAQVSMFPAMVQGCVSAYIERYRDFVLAYKMPGAGGGGYLACVVEDAPRFAMEHPESILLTIRRPGM
jgi:galactokinase/mevalonate kinase-like predicted kinase